MAKKEEAKKVKNLTVEELKKQNKKLDEQVEVLVEANGEMYRFTHDAVFRKSKIYKMLDDFVDFLNEGNYREEMFDLLTPYISLLIIKHFTSIEVPDDIDEALNLLEVMIDLEVLDKILNSLPEEELMKIYEILDKVLKNLEENTEEAEKLTEEIFAQVENEEIKKLVNGDGAE